MLSVSPIPALQMSGIPMAIISPCLVGDDAFLEYVERIKNTELSKIEICKGTSLCNTDLIFTDSGLIPF